MKQEALASTLRISRGSLANIETGKQSILVHQLYNFATALQLAVSDLLPSAPGKASASERTELPLPSDLKSAQKEQVARLFLQGDQNLKPQPETNHVKARKEN